MSRYINPVPQITKILNGVVVPIVGAKLFFFETGTTTKKTIYSDSSFSTPISNPVLSDANGRYSDDIFLDGVYKSVQQDDSGTPTGFDGVTIWTKDPVGEVEAGQFDPWTNDATYNIPDIVKGSDDEYYRSIIDSNQGNDPTSTASAWEELEFGRIWNTNVSYLSGETVFGSDGLKYIARADNSGNNPITDDSNWRLLNDNPLLINNVAFTAAVATKALTVSLKTNDLTDPTLTDKCVFSFRNSTLTSSKYEIVSATAADSIVIPSGATLEFANSETDFIYVYVLNNTGSVEIAISGKALNEDALHTTIAIGTLSDSGSTLYSNTARSNVAIRSIGRFKIQTGAVAGEWDNAPTDLYTSPNILFGEQLGGDYIKLTDTQATTVDGGSSIAGTQTREINTEDQDTGDNCELLYSLDYDAQTSNFTVGQVVTDGTSGATGTIVADEDSGATGILWIINVSGTFGDGNTITDPLGGSATANIPSGLLGKGFYLNPGRYKIDASSPTFNTIKHKAILYNISDASNESVGSSEYASGTVTRALIKDEFEITSNKAFRIDHYTQNAVATTGLGVNTGDGTNEVYTIVELRKIK